MSLFISYSHDSAEHAANVLSLADRLRADGVNAMVDQYQSAPPEGWQLWMEKQIRDAAFVLLVCTETYLRRVMKEETPGAGLGVVWESAISYSHLYAAGLVNEKFIPVVFRPEDTQYIPLPLQPTTYYNVGTEAGYERLYRRLTGQPETAAPPLGSRRAMPPRPRPAAANHPAGPVTPNLVHPYPMQANFTGRADERRELSAWLADDARPACALVAMGGMGKSALAWHWLTHDVLATAAPALDGVMWWSFYEGESSFAKFIDDAFRYVGGRPNIDAARFPTTYDRAQELRRLLQTRRVLFILDGFERQLRAYARLDAAYQPDDAAATSREARDCVDPVTARWLRGVAAGPTRAKVLLTARLMPHDLEDRAGDPLAGVLARELRELPRDDAVAFMRLQGVTKGTPAEIAAACADYGYHPLSLRLLSGFIARDARTPGDIAAAPRHDVHADLVQRRHHILQQSYDALPAAERALLSRMAAFRHPTTYDTLTIFNESADAADFEAALEDLRARGLLQRDLANKRYDLHPIVRRYAYDRLADKTDVHARLRDYFAQFPMPEQSQARSIEDLMPAVELYYHTVGAGQYDEAAALFDAHISDLLFYRFGAYQTLIELLRMLFPEGEDRPPRLADESMQGSILNQLANPYGLSGQPRNAIRSYQQAMAIAERCGQTDNVAACLGAVSSIGYFPLGELAVAERNYQKRIEICRGLKASFSEAIGHQALGQLLTYRGAFDEAAEEFNKACQLSEEQNALQSLSVVWRFHAVRALMMQDARAAMAAARQSLEYWKKDAEETYPVERDVVHIELLFGAALVLEGKDLSAAAVHLTEALTRCRRINLVEAEPGILLAWARWHRARGEAQEARAYAEEALAIADRCEFRLAQAEIHNLLARLASDAGEREAAREEAEMARERAWCDGPPYCYKPALEEAEAMLRSLGVGESILSSPPAAR